MNDKDIEEKLNKEKAKLVSEMKYKNIVFIKAIKTTKDDIEYLYYEVIGNDLKKVEDGEMLKNLKRNFELPIDNIID